MPPGVQFRSRLHVTQNGVNETPSLRIRRTTMKKPIQDCRGNEHLGGITRRNRMENRLFCDEIRIKPVAQTVALFLTH
jgi:hypothetical protein